MPGGYAQNAVMAKVKALYGKRLRQEDYRQLLEQHTVGEVAAYLKHNTYYSNILGEVREDLVHRGQLESLVRRHGVELFGRLMRYGGRGELFPQLYTMRAELRQLLAVLRLLDAGSMNQYVLAFPAYLNHHLSFDLFALAEVSSYDDLLHVVRGSDYYGLLGPFRPRTNGERIDIPGCERALLTHYYTQSMELVKRDYRGDTRRDLLSILHVQIDLHNLMTIYRLKRFFGASPMEIQARLIPLRGKLTPKQMALMVESVDASDLFSHLRHTQLLRRLAAGEDDMRHLAASLRQHTSRKVFRYSIRPPVVVLSYLALLEQEEENLISVIEGVRYGLSADEVLAQLVI